MRDLPFGFSSTCAQALILTAPRPVVYAETMPSLPIIRPPVGKSGPFIAVISSAIVTSGLSIIIKMPSITSPKLCGGILVAIPTAIPAEPLTKRLGILDGRTVGSFNDSS